MKILHTSDWHLGHVLYGYDRSDEQADFLRQVVSIVREHQPDAMVVTGDVYHYSTPAASTQRMYTDGMLAIHLACPTMSIIVTAGNHDSPSRLEVDSSLWARQGVHVVSRIERRPANAGQGQGNMASWSADAGQGQLDAGQGQSDKAILDQHIIEVSDATGRPVGLVAAVPYVYPQNFPTLGGDCPRDERQARFFQALLDRVEEINVEKLPVVLTAHLAVSGSTSRGHDESVGGMEWVPLDDLGDGYDYLALGHIHCPQNVPGSNGHARYCGTPLAVSFDEDYSHSVSMVQVEHGQRPQLETIEIETKRPLRTVPQVAMPLDKALNALSRYPVDAPDYIRLQALTEGTYLPADCMELARSAMAGKACRLCLIKPVRQNDAEAITADLPELSLEEFRQTTPLEIARRFYQEHEGEEMNAELTDMFQEAVRRIQLKDKA